MILSLAVVATSQPVAASHRVGHSSPQGPARLAFGTEFPALVDREWGFALGGWGGISKDSATSHVPVIFVHGNNVDASDWYPVRDDFLAAGWTLQELYALSYNGLGGANGSALFRSNPQAEQEREEMGWDGNSRVTGNDVNVDELHDFIQAVRTYAGSSKFSLVAHSLGVTLARRVLKVFPALRQDLVAFVGIAGANHGTSFCPPGSEDFVMSCDEIAAGTLWLESLNGPGGADETYGPAQWLTVYDGSGAGDPAFLGTYSKSPVLKGAVNLEFPLTYHNDLRINSAIVSTYREFLEDAETNRENL